MGYWDDNKEFEFLFLNGIFFVLNLSQVRIYYEFG